MTAEMLRLGIIGASPGNGHPYSWSAICNGYDQKYMENCGFPLIPRYLESQVYPDDYIHNARVTHIWTQETELSKKIAKTSKIPYIINDLKDLVRSVDAVLLARDDAENHLHFAKPVLQAGLPIYIDKPLSLSTKDAQTLLGLQLYSGQIFSCSALRYADELAPDISKLEKVGTIKSILGFTPKDWDKYAVHVIEPLLKFLPDNDEVVQKYRWQSNEVVSLHLLFASGIDVQISSYGESTLPISIKIIGSSGCIDLEFIDTFSAFKKSLQDFIACANQRKPQIESSHMMRVVSLIEMGRLFS